jgi:hypothetical protein
MIEFVFSASPETIRGEASGDLLLCPVGQLQDLAACAFMNPDVFAFPSKGKAFRLPSIG